MMCPKTPGLTVVLSLLLCGCQSSQYPLRSECGTYAMRKEALHIIAIDALLREHSQNDHEEWRYRYNAMGEREQKRMYWAPMADNQPNNAYPWEYYLLSGKQQLSVWAGQQMSLASCDSTGRRVYMYPTEYLSYGVGSSALLTTRPNGVKQYKIVDHLGSTRAVVSGGGSVGWQQDYDPYGSVLAGAIETRKGYIDKERDRESGTHNHGVRQYDPGEGGRFLSFDPLWEKYRGVSPYHYALNNPIQFVDANGLFVNLSDLIASGSADGQDYSGRLISELEALTGLKLYVENGDLKYVKVEGNPIVDGGSLTARELLSCLIDGVNSGIFVEKSNKTSRGDQATVKLNAAQIEQMEQGVRGGLNPLTLGWGMIFFHESLHTDFGDNFSHNPNMRFGTIDFTDDIGNQIRREMGVESFGQRLSYKAIGLSPTSQEVFIPFSLGALRSLSSDPPQPPGGMYIVIPTTLTQE